MIYNNINSKNFLSTYYQAPIFYKNNFWTTIQEFIDELFRENKNIDIEYTFINITIQKFLQHPELKAKLLRIKKDIIDEHESDIFIKNFTGRVLTCVRDTFKKLPLINIASWNVNGIRSKILSDEMCKRKYIDVDKESNFQKLVNISNSDVVCLQETRCSEDVGGCINMPEFPYKYWNCSKRKEKGRGSGYSGTAILSKIKPSRVEYDLPTLKEKNIEGRIIIAHFKNFILITVYVPNSISNEEYRIKIWDPAFLKYLKKLRKENKSVVVCGDLNVAYTPQDIWKVPRGRTSGYLPEERKAFSKYLENSYVDVFRKLYPYSSEYTYWSMLNKFSREYNRGWRIDYFLVNDELMRNVISSNILKSIGGSDHSPIILSLLF